MKVLNININNFGGSEKQLMAYKKINNKGIEVIDWKRWAEIDKTSQVDNFCSYIDEQKPDIVVLQEFELNNSVESYNFIDWMKEKGYEFICESYKFKLSMTVMFVLKKEFFSYKFIESPHDRSARSCAIKAGSYIIYGTHVPSKYDENYWTELISFYNKFKKEKLILIGDFNVYAEGTKSKAKYNELINNGAIDLWLKQGNPNSTPTEKKYKGRLDYVFTSPEAYNDVLSMDIHQKTMCKNISDHAALILEIE